jgi:amino-acid N-acetyltransferase
MKIRNAVIQDAKEISALINSYAEHDIMLFRSLANIYENIQAFTVAEDQGKVVGCGALQVIWADLAEIKSLAVRQDIKKQGVGSAIVDAACQKADKIGIKRVFALTLAPGFFEKMGFELIEKDELPMKVWSDCASCPKQQNCDEIAFIKNL